MIWLLQTSLFLNTNSKYIVDFNLEYVFYQLVVELIETFQKNSAPYNWLAPETLAQQILRASRLSIIAADWIV